MGKLYTKCAICGEQHEFDWSWLCKKCDKKIRDAMEEGRLAIRATALFNSRKIGFAELKEAYRKAGIELSDDDDRITEDMYRAIGSVVEEADGSE